MKAIVFVFVVVFFSWSDSAWTCDVSSVQNKMDFFSESHCLKGAAVFQQEYDPQNPGDAYVCTYKFPDSFGLSSITPQCNPNLIEAALEQNVPNFQFPVLWNPIYTIDDFKGLRAHGANVVVLSVPGTFDVVAPYGENTGFKKSLNYLVELAKEAGLYVIIAARTGPGRGEGDLTPGGGGLTNSEVYDSANTTAQNAYADMWASIASDYKDEPAVIGYELMVEPSNAATKIQWVNLAKLIVRKIRPVDSSIPLIVDVHGFANSGNAIAFGNPMVGPFSVGGVNYNYHSNVIYSVHQYGPYDYTHQHLLPVGSTPPTYQQASTSLNTIFQDLDTWSSGFSKPVFIGEFGVIDTASLPGLFMGDQLSLMESRGWSSAAWIWAEDYDPSYNFNDFDIKDKPGIINNITPYWGDNLLFSNITKHSSFECGAPSFSVTSGEGKLFVYHDCGTNKLKLRAKGDGTSTNYTLSGQVDGTETALTHLETQFLEGSDSTQLVNSNLSFALQVRTQGVDEISVLVPKQGELCLTNTGTDTISLKIGKNAIAYDLVPGVSYDLLSMSVCN